MVNKISNRIHELDLLRGFFILVIVVDHFQRWPSLFTYVTGQGRLWASAAEGFFIISGLLIGYLRGYRQRNKTMGELSKILLKRALMLYLASVVVTFIVASALVLFPAGDPLVPIGPNTEQTASLGAYITAVFTQTYANDWIFFLRLYAIMLAASPLFIFLLRRGWWSVALLLSVGLYASSFLFEEPEAALQWQALFFGAGLVGYKLDSIRKWFNRHKVKQYVIAGSITTFTLITMVVSYYWVLGWDNNPKVATDASYLATRQWLDPIFDNAPLTPVRIALSFVWVGGLFAMLHYLRGFIMKWFDWLLMLFGKRSLSAYCLQAVFLLPVQLFIPRTKSIAINTVMTIALIVVFWAVLRIPLVQRVLPR